MASSGSGKSSPFNSNGRSGAVGNSNPAPPPMRVALPSRPQQFGNGRAPQSVANGGPTLQLDPPSDRGGDVGTFARKVGNKRPFRLGTPTANESGPETPSEFGPGAVGVEPPSPDTIDDGGQDD